MNRTIRKTAAFAAVILSVGAVTALAANSPPLVGVPKGAMNGVHRATSANGALKANAVGNRQIKFGSVSCRKLSADLAAAICTGKPGAPGTPGAPGADGNAGSSGKNGDTGSNGGTGSSGSNGSNGSNGSKGDKGNKGNTGDAGTYVVTTHVTGPDSSACGGDWATDTYTRTLQFTPQDNGSINVLRTYDGTFTTIAGAATPDAPCDVLGASFTGTFTGFDVVTVTGGHFLPDAICAANCTSDAMMTAFFPGGTKSGPNAGWEYHYDAGAHGSWVNADATSRGGNSGNITG